MKTTTLPTLLLLVLAPLPALADGPPAAPAEETAAAQPAAEELPYGAGYEARRRQDRKRDGQSESAAEEQRARGGEEERARAELESRERDRTESRAASNEARVARAEAERPSATRAARREARERWGQHGKTRN